MMKVPMKMYWRGEDIETLPREKLIEIIQFMQQQIQSARATTDSILRVNRAAREARQRLGQHEAY